jgi:hypothetical protein
MSLGILLLSTDLNLAKDLQSASKLCSVPIAVYPCSSGQKFNEYGTKFKIGAILIDENFNDPVTENWIAKLRIGLSKELGNDKAPFFLLCPERDESGVRAAIRQGYLDIFSKPVDLSFLFQKLQLYIPQIRFLKEDLLFSMDVRGEAQVAITGRVVRASEYGATIETPRAFQAGEILTIYSDMLSVAESSTLGSNLVRVLGSTPSSVPHEHHTSVIFLGPQKSILVAIRLWLKRQYVKASSSL